MGMCWTMKMHWLNSTVPNTCSAWSFRLEETLNTAVRLRKVSTRSTNGMKQHHEDLCGNLNRQRRQPSDPVICYKCGQEEHIAVGCRFKRGRGMVKSWGQGSDQRRQSPIHQELVGTSNDVQVAVNNIECKALLDTGATVSSTSKTFYDYYLVLFPYGRALVYWMCWWPNFALSWLCFS